MDLNEMRKRHKEQRAQSQEPKASIADESVTISNTSQSLEPQSTQENRTLSSSVQDTKPILYLDDGATYVGSLDKKGIFSGHGVYTFPDGTIYDGLWSGGQRNGAGTQTWPNGTKYVGNWKDDKCNGIGTMTWPDGSRYSGRWKNDTIDTIYEGHYYYNNGEHYEGSFNSDWQRNGCGRYYWRDGSYYYGSWVNDKRHGQGELFDEHHRLVCKGQWINDEFKSCKNNVNTNYTEERLLRIIKDCEHKQSQYRNDVPTMATSLDINSGVRKRLMNRYNIIVDNKALQGCKTYGDLVNLIMTNPIFTKK